MLRLWGTAKKRTKRTKYTSTSTSMCAQATFLTSATTISPTDTLSHRHRNVSRKYTTAEAVKRERTVGVCVATVWQRWSAMVYDTSRIAWIYCCFGLLCLKWLCTSVLVYVCVGVCESALSGTGCVLCCRFTVECTLSLAPASDINNSHHTVAHIGEFNQVRYLVHVCGMTVFKSAIVPKIA